jgi:hypothetical protein
MTMVKTQEGGVGENDAALIVQAWGPMWVDEECVVLADKEDVVPEALMMIKTL